MRVFIAGATGVLGRSLIRKLLERGHSVVGTSNTESKLAILEKLGVEPRLMNGTDRTSVMAAVYAAGADVVVNEMTSLAHLRDYKNFDAEFALTNRLRSEGTSHLLAAARASGVKRLIVQSFAGWPWQRNGRSANSEEAPFEAHVPAKMKNSQEAIKQMESMTVSSQDLVGIVLRYGHFYGAGTSFGSGGETVKAVRKRGFPLIGGGNAVWSLVHVDDAAEATRIAIESAPGGIYNIADDQPATVAEWLPYLAKTLGAKQPMNLPAWLGRMFIGESGLFLMNAASGADNTKARNILNWTPVYPDWRIGLAETLASEGNCW